MCRWLGVRSGHILLGSAPLDLVTPSSLGTLGRDRGKERPELLDRAGEGLQRGPTLSLPHFKAAQAPGLSHS